MRRLKLIFFAELLLVFLLGVFVSKSSLFDFLFPPNPHKEKLNYFVDAIETSYVNAVNTDSIVDQTISYILKNLDPHSVYIPKTEATSIQETMQGSFVGIGIRFRMLRDSLVIMQVLEGGPAQKAGLKSGDRILIANQDTLFCQQLSRDIIPQYLKGKIGTQVHLQVYRKQNNTMLNFDLNRDIIPIKSVEASYMLTKDLGYIKIAYFSQNTYMEFNRSLAKLKKKGLKALVIDLRENSGGSLKAAEDIADDFLPEGKVIVSLRDRSEKEIKTYAKAFGSFESKPVYVLVNETSASASEVVAGALQDNDIGTIIGRRSFGKGLVQTEISLPDGSKVRLTTARYFTPTGRSIQRSYKSGNKAYYQDYIDRMHSGELLYRDSIKIDSTKVFRTPKGKIVYGGGGIIPDVFVPMEKMSNHVGKWQMFLYDFTFDYLDRHRDQYDKISESEFINSKIATHLYNAFIVFSQKHGFKAKELEPHRSIIERRLKIYIAQQLFGNQTYIKIKNQKDTVISKAMFLWKKNKGYM